METKHKSLTVEKMRLRQEFLGLLETQLPVEGETHYIKNEDGSIHDEYTLLFRELSGINSRRFEIIKELMGEN